MPGVDEAIERLTRADYQITPQRRYILDLCDRAEGHFTAERLYELDREGQDDLSRATIYNTLHILVEVGYLRELPDVGSSRFYEIRKQPHPHARCRSCGKLTDIPVDLEEQVERWDTSFEIDTVRMTVDGLCPSCGPREASASS